jgi:hypothetical protein
VCTSSPSKRAHLPGLAVGLAAGPHEPGTFHASRELRKIGIFFEPRHPSLWHTRSAGLHGIVFFCGSAKLQKNPDFLAWLGAPCPRKHNNKTWLSAVSLTLTTLGHRSPLALSSTRRLSMNVPAPTERSVSSPATTAASVRTVQVKSSFHFGKECQNDGPIQSGTMALFVL